MKKTIDAEKLNQALSLLNELLFVANAPKTRLVVCGGSALIGGGLYARTTNDVDVLALSDGEKLLDPQPLPEYLSHAAKLVRQQLNLPEDWLNCGPVDLFYMGLPEGLQERLSGQVIGEFLEVYYLARIDQIFFKLYAAADRGGYHVDDLLRLTPTEDELSAAAQWAMTHDVSEGFRSVVKDMLNQLGYENVSRRIAK